LKRRREEDEGLASVSVSRSVLTGGRNELGGSCLPQLFTSCPLNDLPDFASSLANVTSFLLAIHLGSNIFSLCHNIVTAIHHRTQPTAQKRTKSGPIHATVTTLPQRSASCNISCPNQRSLLNNQNLAEEVKKQISTKPITYGKLDNLDRPSGIQEIRGSQVRRRIRRQVANMLVATNRSLLSSSLRIGKFTDAAKIRAVEQALAIVRKHQRTSVEPTDVAAILPQRQYNFPLFSDASDNIIQSTIIACVHVLINGGGDTGRKHGQHS
jgi:hypothetical protein